MNRALLWLLGALVLGAVAGQMVLDDPGFVLVGWHAWVLETSLWVALAAASAVLVALLLALGMLDVLAGTLARWRERREARRHRLARELADRGLAQLADGDWRKATSTLLKAAETVDAPLLLRLAGAQAAEADGRVDLAAQVLHEARDAAGEASSLVDLRLAGFHLRHGDPRAARDALETVLARTPRHGRALPLLAEVLAVQGDWHALVARLAALRKLLPAEEWLAVARRACGGQLAAIGADAAYPSRRARLEALQSAWKAMPAECRADEAAAAAYADTLVAIEAVNEARDALEQAIEDTIAATPGDTLIARYGRLDVDKPLEQLARVEKWLVLRPTHPALLLAAARTSLRNRLWGKARDYLEASVARQATPETCAELVRLYSRLGETAKAELYLRRHAELTGTALPVLPMPTARM